MVKTAELAGVDISDLVASWPSIDRSKNVILGQEQLFVSQADLVVENAGGWGRTRGPGSALAGIDWYGAPLDLSVDGKNVFRGELIDPAASPRDGTVSLSAQNVFKRPAEKKVVLDLQGVDPALVALEICRACLPATSIDEKSFYQASGQSRAAAAVVDFLAEEGDDYSGLQALQDVANLASLSFVDVGGIVRCRAFRPYQGSDSELRFDLTDAMSREWGELRYDDTAFTNRVSVGYPTDSFVTLEDGASIRSSRGSKRDKSFSDTAAVRASDKNSAEYFARTYLRRASPRRGILPMAAGPELASVIEGDRHLVVSSDLGLTGFPVEVIGTKLNLDVVEVELTLAQLV